MSAVNSIVRQLLEREFQVFQRSVASEEQNVLEQALKVLKVLFYLCKNTNLVSLQGTQFLLNN